jgi:hypothetical protein
MIKALQGKYIFLQDESKFQSSASINMFGS